MKQYKYHIPGSIQKSDYDPSFTSNTGEHKQFERQLDLELTNLDVSIVNALRRILFSEIETVAVGDNFTVNETDNVTVFNSEYLKERISMLPIHLDSVEELETYRDNIKLLFVIGDPNNWDKPLANGDNTDKIVTCADILVLEKTDNVVNPEEFPPLKKEEAKEKPPLEEDDAIIGEEVAKEAAKEAEKPLPVKPARTEKATDRLIPSQYRRLDSKNFFKYQDMYLLKLKKGESIYMTMRPAVGIGKTHARWHSSVVVYRFKSEKQSTDPNYNWKEDKTYESIKDLQNYRLSSDPAVRKYGVPETFKLTLEYNGHYRPSLSWLSAIRSLKSKVSWFQDQARQITGSETPELGGGGGGKVTDRLRIEFSPKDRIQNLVTLTVVNEGHTLGNLLASHYLYNLERLVGLINPENSEEIILNGFSHYRVPYILNPVEINLFLMFKTPEWSEKQTIDGFAKLIEYFKKEGETVQPYDDDFYIKNPTIRLLMIVIERLLNTFDVMEKEFTSTF